MAAAAAAAGRPLVRFNLSARTTPEDLLARPVLAPDPDTGSEALHMQLQPFAVAFRDGAWLLLDELNLCPESVLLVRGRGAAAAELLLVSPPCTLLTHPTETTLALGSLRRPWSVPWTAVCWSCATRAPARPCCASPSTPTSASSRRRTPAPVRLSLRPSLLVVLHLGICARGSPHPRHASPFSAGQFRDKREQLSASFLSRFQQVTFAELPAEEWQEVRLRCARAWRTHDGLHKL